MSNWTDRQLDAINARDTAVIVSAAAGSGKTSVLVERLVRILSDPVNKVPADRIIVVTFTNDAAAQMKQRLSDALSAQLELEPNNYWLCRQQSLISAAKISTIHSFCFDMIRENIQSLDISSGFRILDETEEELIVSKALGNVFEQLYEENPEMMNELTDFTCKGSRNDSNLERVVLKIHRFIMSLPFPEDALDGYTIRYSEPFDSEKDPLAKAYAGFISDSLNRIARLADYAAELVSEAGESKASDIISGERDLFISLAEKAMDTSLEWNERFGFDSVKFEVCRYPKTDKGSPEQIIVEKVKEIRKNYKEQAAKLSSEAFFSLEDIFDDYDKCCNVLRGLSIIVKKLITETARIKSEKNALGFSDAEQLAVKLLCAKDEKGTICKTPLARELSEYYSLIMIDEFQDANNIQNTIFRMLSRGGTAESNGDNLFVVGDVKQSIYRFRLANPKNFIDVLESSDIYTPEYKGKNAAVLLNRNFRSSKDVVDFVNDVFATVMSKAVGDIDYTVNEQLEAGAVYPEANRSAEFIFTKYDPSAENDNAEVNNASENADEGETVGEVCAEARAVAIKISSMLGLRTVFDKGELRPCECKDFCILLRDRARGQLYADELLKIGIKATCEETTGYLKSREIAVLVNILTVIDNPMRDIPLVSVLMSPMFMLTADEMAELRLLTENKYDHIYKCVLFAMQNQESYSAAGKLKKFIEIYEKLRICAASQSLERLIRTIYDSTDFLSSVQAYSDGDQKKANLRLLLEYAKSYEQNSAGGLSGFIRYLHDISEKGGDFVRASIVSPADNAVSIKTIHKAKGLEYPFVFLCGTSKPFNLKDSSDYMQINLDYGIGFKIQDRNHLKLYNSFPQYVISRINRQDTISEEMRLLYVALTRAKEQLFITVPNDGKTAAKIDSISMNIAALGGVTPVVAASARSMLDWLLMALLTHPDGSRIQVNPDIPIRSSKAKITVTESDSALEEADKEQKEKAVPDEESVRQLLDSFNFHYESRLPNTLAKLTITEIAKSENDEIFLRRPDFSADYSSLTPAEIGTAMHTFMQYADYSAAETDLIGQAKALEEKGLLGKAEAEALNLSQLKKFFDSDFYGRIKNSPEIRREQKFLIEISELGLDDELGLEYNNTNGMLQGIADCVFEENGEIVLVDYKTDRVNSEIILADRYRRQLLLYSAALEKIFDKKVKEAYLYSFSLGREIKIK
ncbi:MAG: helicase-exonuclease AddAB subunit AddA [Oscillospiraceae bacterium]|nr:helicase-exonuclease AddAB subunit AddA [Oscillospiraceae bacterium]